MNETELADYCRYKGLYREQITAWQKICLQANGKVANHSQELNVQLKKVKQQSNTLEKNLEKEVESIGQAAALLLLKKRARAIRGGKKTND